MKLLTKMTILALSLSSAFANAATAQSKSCQEVEGGKSCVSFQVTIPDYPYSWLNDFALKETFEVESAKLADLQKLSDEYVKEVLGEGEDIGDDSEKVTWGKVEEEGDYLQIAKHDYLKVTGEEEAIEDFSYYVFNKKSPDQALSFDDILTSAETVKPLVEVLKESYLTWLKNRNISEDEIKEILNNTLEDGEMLLSDNWFLAKDNIIFHYGSNEITPPNYGGISLAVPTKALEGLIKPEILQAAQTWKTSFPAN